MSGIEETFKTLFKPGMKLRDQSWERFLGAGLPSRDSEGYKHVRLRDLYSSEFTSPALAYNPESSSLAKHILPECQESCLVFINGAYRADLSKIASLPKECVVIPLSAAATSYGAFLSGRFAKEQDPFALLNGALMSEGLFLYVPPKCVLDSPIQLIHIIDSDQPIVCSPRLHLLAGRHTSLKIHYTTHQVGIAAHFINAFADISLEEGAAVTWTNRSSGLVPSSHLFGFRAALKRDSLLKCVTIGGDEMLYRQNVRVELLEERAEAQLAGLLSLGGKREGHFDIFIHHRAPFTLSMQKFKSVLEGMSRHSFNGKIFVDPVALKTQAYQRSSNLLLSDRALCYCQPNLEILADDVKASHGATIGQLDEDHLFYLMTRGIPPELAKQILLEGFTAEITEMLQT